MKKKRILIVEDEGSILKLETILLTVKGYEVSGALNGKEALEKLSLGVFDLVLLDIMLPDIDGFEVCRSIRNNPQTSMIPIIMLTAKKTPEDHHRGLSCGADGYITKPFKSASIIEEIEGLLQRNGISARS